MENNKVELVASVVCSWMCVCASVWLCVYPPVLFLDYDELQVLRDTHGWRCWVPVW